MQRLQEVPTEISVPDEISELYQVFPITTGLCSAAIFLRCEGFLRQPRCSGMNGNVLPRVGDVEDDAGKNFSFAKKANSCAYFGVYYVGPLPDPDRQREFDKKLMDCSKEIGFRSFDGFQHVYKGSAGTPDDWKVSRVGDQENRKGEQLDGPPGKRDWQRGRNGLSDTNHAFRVF